MRTAFAVAMAIHALIHLMGFAKAFGLAELPQLVQPITRPIGLAWLTAALLLLAAVGALYAWPRGWWTLGLAGLVLSQLVIMSAWSDAKAGTIANLVLLLGCLYGLLNEGPTSLRAAYEAEVARGRAQLGATAPPDVVTEADLAPLPPPVRRYLERAGVVGQPRTLEYTPRFRGRIRGGPTDAWMPFEAEQTSFASPPARLFFMHATMFGLPVEVLHRFVGPSATMQVRLLGAIPIADARGPEMDRAETVTLLNDMCILAPSTLLSPSIAWEPIDERTARARFTHGANVVTATLHFDEEGWLVDFVSDDRLRASRDGTSFTSLRFPTPLSEPRPFGALRLLARGEARWHAPPPENEFAYGEFDLTEIGLVPPDSPTPPH